MLLKNVEYAGREADVRCRGCNGNAEMQEHCLNVCKGNMQAMRVRHNKVVERLVRAIQNELGQKFLDQSLPGCSEVGRPNVVVLNHSNKKAFLVDVTCPCETGENLKAARSRKIEKYDSLKRKLEEDGYMTTLDALVVGSLGAWDPENDPLLTLIGIGQKYGTLFKKLCCQDAISGTYDLASCGLSDVDLITGSVALAKYPNNIPAFTLS